MQDFDWSDVADDTLFESVGAVAVYENPKGDIVIRQQSIGYDEDQVIVVPTRYLDSMIQRLEQMRLELQRRSKGD